MTQLIFLRIGHGQVQAVMEGREQGSS